MRFRVLGCCFYGATLTAAVRRGGELVVVFTGHSSLSVGAQGLLALAWRLFAGWRRGASTVPACGDWGILAGFSKVPFASALRHGNQPDPQ